MTEVEWLNCTDPAAMLGFLKGKSSDRKLILFVVAARSLVERRDVEISAFNAAARFADGFATLDEVRYYWLPRQFRWVVNEFAWPERPFEWASSFVECCPFSDDEARRQHDPTRAELILVLRELFGNPFRTVTLSPAVLAWNDALVVRLAQTAYDERHLPAGTLDNSRLAILADALEEAGCTDADILGHLRKLGPHVRGCWVVDLLLGKE